MSIVDQYIADHYHDPIESISAAIGLPITFILLRKDVVKPTSKAKTTIIPILNGIQNEMAGLIQLINERGNGWAVEVAKERLLNLQRRL